MMNKISENILILGYTEDHREVLKELKKQVLKGTSILGIVDNNISKGKEVEGIPFLGKVIDLEEIAKKNKIGGIIQIAHLEQSFNMIIFSRANNLDYWVVDPDEDFHAKNFKKESWGSLIVMKMMPTPLSGLNLVIKNLFDFVFSWIFMIAFSPIFLTIFIVLKLEDYRAPAFVSEKRFSGYSGKDFNMYKFRSLPRGVEEKSAKYNYEKAAEKLREIKKDERATIIGKFLRKFYLVELPQLFNIAKSEMSLIGPRPPYAKEVKDYTDSLRKRVIVKPGMTGLWQTQRGESLTFQEMFEQDSFYVENWSFLLDLKIVLKTIRKIFSKR